MFSFITSFAITLPETATSDVLASVSGIWGDLLPLTLLIIGIPVGFWILGSIINTMTPKETTRYTMDEAIEKINKTENAKAKERRTNYVDLTTDDEEYFFDE